MNTIDEKKIAEQTVSEIKTKRVPDDELEGVSGGIGENPSDISFDNIPDTTPEIDKKLPTSHPVYTERERPSKRPK